MIKIINNRPINDDKTIFQFLSIDEDVNDILFATLLNKSIQELIEHHSKTLFFPCQVIINKKNINDKIACPFHPVYNKIITDEKIVYDCGMQKIPYIVKFIHLMIVQSLFNKRDLVENKKNIFDNLELFLKQLPNEVYYV